MEIDLFENRIIRFNAFQIFNYFKKDFNESLEINDEMVFQETCYHEISVNNFKAEKSMLCFFDTIRQFYNNDLVNSNQKKNRKWTKLF